MARAWDVSRGACECNTASTRIPTSSQEAFVQRRKPLNSCRSGSMADARLTFRARAFVPGHTFRRRHGSTPSRSADRLRHVRKPLSLSPGAESCRAFDRQHYPSATAFSTNSRDSTAASNTVQGHHFRVAILYFLGEAANLVFTRTPYACVHDGIAQLSHLRDNCSVVLSKDVPAPSAGPGRELHERVEALFSQ